MKTISPSSSLVIPDYSFYNESIRKSNKFASLEIIKKLIFPKIEEWANLSNPQLYIPIDGLSGSGKSTLANVLSEIKKESVNSFEIITIGVDMFISTERDSKERALMPKSITSFWKGVYRRDIMKNLLKNILSLGKNGKTIPVENAYSHETGKLELKKIAIPSGKKIILIDGIDATNVVDEILPEEEKIRLFVFAEAEISLLSACCRDAEKKDVIIEERLIDRTKEYVYLTAKLVKTLIRPDVIVFDNTKGHRPLSEQLVKFERIKQLQNSV